MKKIALLFPGQGSQYIGMGKYLCERYQVAKKTFEQANEVVGFDLMELCFHGGLDELTRTENTQPAILTASVAAFRVYMDEIGVEPEFLAGHSLGEISALVCAGAIEFKDAVKIVRKRGIFMQEAVPVGIGSMSAISGIAKEVINKECSSYKNNEQVVVISNYNAPDQIVISGHLEAVSEVGKRLIEAGARVTPLQVSAPFHSPLMQTAADSLNEELKNYNYGNIKQKVVSNVTALPYESSTEIIAMLSKHIVSPVRWLESINYMQRKGIDIFVELGAKEVLKNLTKKIIPSTTALSFDKQEDIVRLKEMLSISKKEADLSQSMTFKLIVRCLAIAVCTKNNNFDNDEYNMGVVEPYKEIQKLRDEMEKENREPSIQQMKAALYMLKKVFNTKKTPIDEQAERFNQIFTETGLINMIGDIDVPIVSS